MRIELVPIDIREASSNEYPFASFAGQLFDSNMAGRHSFKGFA